MAPASVLSDCNGLTLGDVLEFDELNHFISNSKDLWDAVDYVLFEKMFFLSVTLGYSTSSTTSRNLHFLATNM